MSFHGAITQRIQRMYIAEVDHPPDMKKIFKSDLKALREQQMVW